MSEKGVQESSRVLSNAVPLSLGQESASFFGEGLANSEFRLCGPLVSVTTLIVVDTDST